LWVIHGDLTGAINFGSYVADTVKGELLGGRYTLGEYLSIINPWYGAHGAEYLRNEFLPNRKTAQSVALPFNYYLDFGFFGVALFSFVCGLAYVALRRYFISGGNILAGTLFVLFFFNLLLSVRNGIFPVNPLFLYCMGGVCFFYKVGGLNGWRLLVMKLSATLFVMSLPVSLLIGLSRV